MIEFKQELSQTLNSLAILHNIGSQPFIDKIRVKATAMHEQHRKTLNRLWLKRTTVVFLACLVITYPIVTTLIYSTVSANVHADYQRQIDRQKERADLLCSKMREIVDLYNSPAGGSGYRSGPSISNVNTVFKEAACR